MEINGCAYPFDRAKTWYPTTDRPVTRAGKRRRRTGLYVHGANPLRSRRTRGTADCAGKGERQGIGAPVSIAASKCLPSTQTKPTPFTSRVNRATSAEAAGLPASTHRYA
jgi:hypothetical protein